MTTRDDCIIANNNILGCSWYIRANISLLNLYFIFRWCPLQSFPDVFFRAFVVSENKRKQRTQLNIRIHGTEIVIFIITCYFSVSRFIHV